MTKPTRDGRNNLPASIIASIRNRKKRSAPGFSPHDPSSGMLVASYNVHKCVGIDGRFDPERTCHVIREIGPDVMALQEADTRFGERRGLLDLHWLERETGLTPVPLSGVTRAHGWHGNVVLFREGLVRDVHQVKLPGLEPRGCLITEIEFNNGSTLRVIAAHLGLLHRSRHQQTRMILDLVGSQSEQPTILLGDLNEWRLGERSSLHALVGAFGGSPAAVASFPSRLPVLALDRIMANRPGLIDHVHVHDSSLARIASDHLPIKAVVRSGASSPVAAQP